jgi:protein-tyrosine phosphatase
LLHTETADGSVIPVWEEVCSGNVNVLKDVMASQTAADGIELNHIRIPITAERPPDFSDLNELIDVVVNNDLPNTPIVVNCQLGRGRSTLASVREILIGCYCCVS